MDKILGKIALGDTVSFDLHVASVVTQNYDNVKVTGIIPARFVDKFGEDAYALHAQVYRLLPPGTIEDDAESYEYIVVEDEGGNTRVIGIPWIDETTIKVHHRSEVVFKLVDMPQEDINQVRDYFARLGYIPTVTINRF